MPIEYTIDRERRVVFVKGRETLTDDDVFGYQREVWSRPDVAGYDELMDMTAVTQIALPSRDRVKDLARLSAAMDFAGPSRFAIVAPSDTAFGLGRMYKTLREMESKGGREVGVFRTMAEALAYLSIEGEPPV
jgi:hypothetical protein